jgi:hypothetical protein
VVGPLAHRVVDLALAVTDEVAGQVTSSLLGGVDQDGGSVKAALISLICMGSSTAYAGSPPPRDASIGRHARRTGREHRRARLSPTSFLYREELVSFRWPRQALRLTNR